MNASEILTKAAGHLADRAVTYDQPEGERSMAKTVAVFNLYHGTQLTEAQGWHLLQILKDVRLFSRPGYHADSAEDCAAYAALKAEAKAGEATPGEPNEEDFLLRDLADSIKVQVRTTTGYQYAGPRAVAAALSEQTQPLYTDADEQRMDIIGSNGPTGEHYDLPDTDALVDPTGKPDWKMAPIWANYLTQDASGVWKWWNKEPAPGGKAWTGIGMSAEVNSGEVRGNWRETLEHAPGLTKTGKLA